MFEIHGHRGCRGLIPQNTVAGVKRALELGVHAVEIDIVVTKDMELLVSHEPWMSAEYCLYPDGTRIDRKDRKNVNLFRMNYDEIVLFDCGSLAHAKFPHQINEHHAKPLFKDLVKVIRKTNFKNFYYNIEIKSKRSWYGEFQPEISEYVNLIVGEIKRLRLRSQCMIQSFDPAILNGLYRAYPKLRLSLLVENKDSFEKNVSRLQFTPEFYNANYTLVDENLVKNIHNRGMKIIPWTVNELKDAERLVGMGVNGIITDYPDRYIGLF